MVHSQKSVSSGIFLDALRAVGGDSISAFDGAYVERAEAVDELSDRAGGIRRFRKVTPFSSLATIFVMVAGSAVAGATDPSFNATGYAWVGICVLSGD